MQEATAVWPVLKLVWDARGQHWAEVNKHHHWVIWYLQCQFGEYDRVMHSPDSILMLSQYVMISLKLLHFLPVPEVPKA